MDSAGGECSSSGVDEASLRELVDTSPSVFFATSAASSSVPWPRNAVHPMDEPALCRAWDACRRAGETLVHVARVRDGHGPFVRSTVRAVPIRNDVGEAICWIATKTASDEPVDAPTRIEDLMRAVCDATDDAIFVKDGSGRYLYVNPTCAKLFSAPLEAIVGTSDDDWFGPEIGEQLRALDREIVAGGRPSNNEESLPVGDGMHLFSTTKGPCIDRHGRVVGIFGISRDITAARAERDRLATMASVVPGAFVTYCLQRDGVFAVPYATPSIVDLFGATPEQLAADPLLTRALTHPDDHARIDEAIAISARDLTPFRCDFRVNHPTRGLVWLEMVAGVRREADGSTLWHGIVLDVTERKHVEHELREQRDRIESLAAASPGAISTFRLSPDGAASFSYVSAAMSEIYGIPAREILDDAQVVFRLVHPDDRAQVDETIARSADTMTPWRCEYRVVNPVRGEIWIEGHSIPRREADGSITWHGILVDITERRRGEAKLRASEAMLRAVVETVPDFLILVGSDKRIQFINRVMPGYSMEQVIGTHASAFLDPSTVDATIAAMDRVVASKEMAVYETGVVDPAGGGHRWFNTRIGPVIQDGAVVAVTLASTDITDRRRAEIGLRESEERYRRLVELLPDAVFVNSGGKISFCNAAFVRLMRADSADQLVGRTPFDVFHPDDHVRIRERVARMQASNEPVPAIEETVVALDGTRRQVSVVAAPILDGTDRAILVVLHDLTSRQRTEHLLSSVLESVSDAILTIDAKGTVLSCNPATRRLFGYDDDGELLGHNVNQLMPLPYRQLHDGSLAAYQKTSEPRVIGRGREVAGRRKDGSVFPIDLAVTTFNLDGAKHFTGVIRDITERKKLEEQFRQAHKMEAFGQLAGGVAHDFNNLLTVILGETEYLGSLVDEPQDASTKEEVKTALADIQDAGERAAGLTRQLLAFSRKTVLEPKVMDLNVIVRETEKMLRRLIGEDIRLTATLAPDLRHVNVDPGQISQVLMNLAVNSRDAMPRGGKLEIETANVTIDAEQSRAQPSLRPGAFVKLTVRDTGIGMPSEVRERVFQPFFTTKGVGKGTGLGLAVVHGIVTQSGGMISVESVEGRGTTFELLLPAATAPIAQPRPDRRPEKTAAHETVLVVEDDDAVRRLAMRVLSNEGYRVLFARDGREALATLASHAEPVALLITDVVMPNMDGRELGEELAKRYPKTRILYVSGYTDDVLLRRGLQSAEVAFLSKPYTPVTLLQAVQRALPLP